MPPRINPRAPASDLWSAPAFPQPVPSFAGRRAELDRMLAHVDADPLFLVYGVGGIGKSELIYQLIRELRARPRWAAAPPLLVALRPGATVSRTLAQLLSAVGAAPAPRRGQPTEHAHLSEQLAQLARALETRPYLVVFDDIHHLPADAVGDALGYLSRRVQASRLIVASRRELTLPAAAPPPVVTTLGPLAPAIADELAAALAERLQLPRPSPAAMRATHGSPFHIHRALVRVAPEPGALADSLTELTPAARRVLVIAAIAQTPPSIERVRRTWSAEASLDDALHDLRQRFLLEGGDALVVHDLVRDALLAGIEPDALAAAHADAAAICTAELRDGDRPPLLLAVDAVSHLLAAARPEEAWRVVERWHSRLAAAGSEHLLRDPLERLRAALPARRVAIDLLTARWLVRASLFADASRVLAGVGGALDDAAAARRAVLAGEIAQHAGELARAEALFADAVARAPDQDTRFQARLRTATAAIFADDGPRARRVLDAALGELDQPTTRQRIRCAWARTVSWMFDERYEAAAAEARAAQRAIADAGLDDLANQLAMLETLACIEAEDMAPARAAAARIGLDGLRRRVASLYRAILRYADGEARAASGILRAAHADLRAHGDTMNAYLAGFYGSAALAECGDLGEAQALAQATAAMAREAGLRGPAARAIAQQALFAAEAAQSGAAHRLAAEVLASGHAGPRAQARAHCAHARAYTIEGDVVRAHGHVALARAAVADPALGAARATIDVEQVAVELVGGDFDAAIALATRALGAYGDRARDYEIARARLVLAAAHVARGRVTDRVVAAPILAQARGLADRGQLRSVQVGCAILAAALARRDEPARAVGPLLAEALRALEPDRASIYAGVLLAAIDGGVVARAVPGAVALLAHLGLSDPIDAYLVDRHGRRAATEAEVARERARREVFVDEREAVIAAGARAIRGRPLLSALLAVLIQARGEAVAAEALYTQVWGAPEYHPLRHRNALYVAINRLRAALRALLPAREVIARVSTGWRLLDDVDACVAVAARRPAEQTT